MAIKPVDFLTKQLMHNTVRSGFKAARPDDQRWQFPMNDMGDFDRSTMGLQMGAGASFNIRLMQSLLGNEQRRVGQSIQRSLPGAKGKILGGLAQWGVSAPVVSSAAEIATKPTLQRHLGRSPEPRLGTGPVSVAAAQAIMPLLMGTVAGGAIHPNIGKVGGQALKPFMGFLRWFIDQENKGLPDLERPRRYKSQRPRRAEPYSTQDPRRGLQQARGRLEKLLEQAIDNPSDLQIAKSMLTSNRNAMNKEMLADFDKSGQSHLLAWSGLHTSILMTYLFGAAKGLTVLGKLGTRYGREVAGRIQSGFMPVSDTDLERQARDVAALQTMVNNAGGSTRVSVPFRRPKNMSQYLANQRYLFSVDPMVARPGNAESQVNRMMQPLYQAIGRSRTAGGAQPVSPVRFRQPLSDVRAVNRPYNQSHATAIWENNPELQGHLLALKYDKMRSRVKPLVKHMLANLPTDFSAENYDVIVPAPITRQTRKQQGYNVNELLARRLSKALNIPLDTSVLTAQQTQPASGGGRSAAEYSVRNQAKVYGKRVLLLEDLITTGLPTAAASRQLRAAGAGNVDVMALARSDRDFATRRVQDDRLMRSFLGISLLSGSNRPAYSYPGIPISGFDRAYEQRLAQQNRIIQSGLQDLADVTKWYQNLRAQAGERAKPSYYMVKRQQGVVAEHRQKLRALQDRRDQAYDDLLSAHRYYNQAQVQNVSVHLGFGGTSPDWSGSGTYIGSGQVLTAAHVLRGWGDQRTPRPTSGYVRNLDTGRVEFPVTGVLLEDMERDVAVLETVAHKAQKAAFAARDNALQQSPLIEVIGADLYESHEELYTAGGRYKRTELGEYGNPDRYGRYRDHSILRGAGVQAGMSGGGWFDMQGHLVGMTSARHEYPTGRVDAVGPDIRVIRQAIEQNRGTGYQLPEPQLRLFSGQNLPTEHYFMTDPDMIERGLRTRQEIYDTVDRRNAEELRSALTRAEVGYMDAMEIGHANLAGFNRYGMSDYRKRLQEVERQLGRSPQRLQSAIDLRMADVERVQDFYNQAAVQAVSVHLRGAPYGYNEFFNTRDTWRGSGVFVAPGQVLTNAHVLRYSDEANRGKWRDRPLLQRESGAATRGGVVRSIELGTENLVEFPILGVIAEDLEADLALLRTVSHTAQRPVGLAKRDPRIASRVRVVGADLYQAGDQLYRNDNQYRREVSGIVNAIRGIGKIHPTLGSNIGVVGSAATQRGMSGGPVYHENNQLVALHRASNPSTGESLGTGVTRIRRFLENIEDIDSNIYDFELLSGGVSAWDRNPNIYYSPLPRKELLGKPALDRDVANYHFLLERLMQAESRAEVNAILEMANRVYEPRRGIRFAAGQIGSNVAAQLLGDTRYRGRGSVFTGQHLSDTLSRQGSVVIPSRVLAEGTASELGLGGITPELWTPRQGWGGVAANLPLPQDTDITYQDVMRHIGTLPSGFRDLQQRLPGVARRPQVEVPDLVAGDQLKLFSGGLNELVREVSIHLDMPDSMGEVRRRWAGSGVFLEPGRVLTASHVLRDKTYDPYWQKKPALQGLAGAQVYALTDNYETAPNFQVLRVLAEDVWNDIALLETAVDDMQATTDIADIFPRAGEIEIIGADMRRRTMSGERIRTMGPPGRNQMPGDVPDWYEGERIMRNYANITVQGGMSGGPWYGQSGELIGITTHGSQVGSGAYSANLEAIHNLLRRAEEDLTLMSGRPLAGQLRLFSGGEEDPARATYNQMRGYFDFLFENKTQFPIAAGNRWIMEAMEGGIPYVEQNLKSVQGQARLISKKWDDFVANVGSGEQALRDQARELSRATDIVDGFSRMLQQERRHGVPIQDPQLRQDIQTVLRAGVEGVQADFETFEQMGERAREPWKQYQVALGRYQKESDRLGISIKEYFEGLKEIEARTRPTGTQLDFLGQAPSIIRSRGIEELPRGLEGLPTFGFELEFFSDTELDDIGYVLEDYGVEMDYDGSLKEAGGQSLEALHEEILENLASQFVPDMGDTIEEVIDNMPGLDTDAWDEAQETLSYERKDRELISRIYQGEQDIGDVHTILKELEQFAPRINETAGMHVHVGTAGLDTQNFANVMGAWLQRESVIDMIHAPYRQGRGTEYALSHYLLGSEDLIKPSAGFTKDYKVFSPDIVGDMNPADRAIFETAYHNKLQQMVERYGDMPGDNETYQAFRNALFETKYRKLNPRGHEFRTIEYRQSAATLDPNEIERHIRFITNFIERYKDEPFVPGPQRNRAEIFRELGFRMADVQGRRHRELLEFDAQRAGIQLLSGRDPNCPLVDLAYHRGTPDAGDWVGSAVMIEPGLAVTNAHVVQGIGGDPISEAAFVSGRDEQLGMRYPIEQLAVFESDDLAFLRFAPTAEMGSTVFADPASIQEGMAVRHRGAQAGAQVNQETRGRRVSRRGMNLCIIR